MPLDRPTNGSTMRREGAERIRTAVPSRTLENHKSLHRRRFSFARGLVAGLISGVLIATTGLGRANYAQAHQVIYSVFPRATAPAAMRVASCETVHFTDFWNNGSHAKGLFQEMPGNHGRVFRWRGRSLRLNWYRISSRGPDWYAARVALFQSRGGTDWSEWSCGWAA